MVALASSGASGTTIIDVNRLLRPSAPVAGTPFSPGSPVTIYTTQGNRPTIPGTGTAQGLFAVCPDVTCFSAGDMLSVDIDQIGVSSGDITVEVLVSFT